MTLSRNLHRFLWDAMSLFRVVLGFFELENIIKYSTYAVPSMSYQIIVEGSKYLQFLEFREELRKTKFKGSMPHSSSPRSTSISPSSSSACVSKYFFNFTLIPYYLDFPFLSTLTVKFHLSYETRQGDQKTDKKRGERAQNTVSARRNKNALQEGVQATNSMCQASLGNLFLADFIPFLLKIQKWRGRGSVVDHMILCRYSFLQFQMYFSFSGVYL